MSERLGVLQFRSLDAPTIKLSVAWYCGDCDAIVEGTNLATCPVCSGIAVWSFLELMADGARRKRRRNKRKGVTADEVIPTERIQNEDGAARTEPPAPLHELEGRGAAR